MGRNNILILFFNTQWGMPINTEGLDLPAECEITTNRERLQNADAVVFHIPEVKGRSLPRKPEDQLWVAWYLECEAHYSRLRDPHFTGRFDLTMTYRRDSDVPVPYYHPGLISAFKKLPRPKSKKKLAALFVSGDYDQSGRKAYIEELMKHMEVHSFGRLFNNKRLEQDRGKETKLESIAGYKFTLAFENASAHDYVTEKFFDPLIAGSVPVYLGAPNVNSFAPGERCYINSADFKSPKELAAYLSELNEDETRYQE